MLPPSPCQAPGATGSLGANNIVIDTDAAQRDLRWQQSPSYTVDQQVNITCSAADEVGGSGLASQTCQSVVAKPQAWGSVRTPTPRQRPTRRATYAAGFDQLQGHGHTGEPVHPDVAVHGQLCEIRTPLGRREGCVRQDRQRALQRRPQPDQADDPACTEEDPDRPVQGRYQGVRRRRLADNSPDQRALWPRRLTVTASPKVRVSSTGRPATDGGPSSRSTPISV